MKIVNNIEIVQSLEIMWISKKGLHNYRTANCPLRIFKNAVLYSMNVCNTERERTC